jgi:hypothetical protein
VSAVVGRKRLDESELLEAVERSVKGSRSELQSCELLDVQDQGVTVLRAVGEAREDQDGCFTGTAQNFSASGSFGFASSNRHVDLLVRRQIYRST